MHVDIMSFEACISVANSKASETYGHMGIIEEICNNQHLRCGNKCHVRALTYLWGQ